MGILRGLAIAQLGKRNQTDEMGSKGTIGKGIKNMMGGRLEQIGFIYVYQVFLRRVPSKCISRACKRSTAICSFNGNKEPLKQPRCADPGDPAQTTAPRIQYTSTRLRNVLHLAAYLLSGIIMVQDHNDHKVGRILGVIGRLTWSHSAPMRLARNCSLFPFVLLYWTWKHFPRSNGKLLHHYLL